GGKPRKLWPNTAVRIVSKNKAITMGAPRFMRTASSVLMGLPLGRKKLIKKAGTKKFTAEGKNKAKNSKNFTFPACHTINVVISPKGLKAPPALAATTMFTQLMAINLPCPSATFMITAHMSNTVVKLSATGEMKKAKIPVIQNNDK